MFHPDGLSLLELLRQALSSTEAGYDLLAPKFDATPFRTPGAILAPIAREVARGGSVRDALDVMCGTGAAMAALRPWCTERVVGMDFSAGMLAEARVRVSQAPGGAAVELVRGDVLTMGFDRAFDVVVCTGAFGHILERDEPVLLGNVQRALRPGGRFVFPTAEPPTPGQPGFWLGHAFNAAMRVRNALLSPPFVMYYLTMLWPAVRAKLERAGFDVE
ncbi:MAG TPA: class I SAM-dependent methyltransferase, partial [Polyangiaceae bacterium]|nr:class I SAM-dependent methyltransferase [Polyangiaceae bacterium]